MPHLSLRRVAVVVAAAVVLSSLPALAQTPALGLTLNDAAQAPGKTLVADVTVTNPGGGPRVETIGNISVVRG